MMTVLLVLVAMLVSAAWVWSVYKMVTDGFVSGLLIWWPLARLTGQALGLLIVALFDSNR